MSDYIEEYLSDPDNSKLDHQVSLYYHEKDTMQKELEVEKLFFANRLRNGLGQSIKDELKKPKRRSFLRGLKYRFLRFLTIRRETKNGQPTLIDYFDTAD